MAGEPWKDYSSNAQPTQGEGPWSDYAKPDATPAPAADSSSSSPGFVRSLVRGFKRSLPETEQLLVGAGAAAAGAVGANGIRDRLLSKYKQIEQDSVAPQQGPSFHDVLEGKANVGDYVGDVVGNFGGQAVQSAALGTAGAIAGSEAPVVGTAAGALGGVLAKGAVKKAIEGQVERMLASQIEKGIVKQGTEDVARTALERKLTRQLGAGAAAGYGLNAAQEIGTTYGSRADDAQQNGEQLTQGDAFRALGYGAVSGGVDTAAEGLNIGRILRGASKSPSVLRRLATGAAEGVLTEGGTEAAQAVLERAGASQSLTDDAAQSDYLENFAAGAVGGGVIGAGGGIHKRHEDAHAAPPPPRTPMPDPANGVLSRVVNTAAAAGALAEQQQPVDQPVAMQMAAQPGAKPEQTYAIPPQEQQAQGEQTQQPVHRLPAPPWINPDTGEVIGEPSVGMAKAYVHDQLNRLEAAGEPIPNRAQWKRELGIGDNLTANTVIGQVQQERKQGLRAPAEQRAAVMDRLRSGAPVTEADRANLGAAETVDGENATRLYAEMLGQPQGRAKQAVEALPAGDDGRRATLTVLQAAQAALRARQEADNGSAAGEPAQAALGLGDAGNGARDARGEQAAPAAAPEPAAAEPVARGADRAAPEADASAGAAVAEPLSDEQVTALRDRNRTPPAVEGDTFDTAKILREKPVGGVALQEAGPGAEGAHEDGAVRWTKQHDGSYSNGVRSVDVNGLARILDGQGDVIEGQSRRIEKPRALPAPQAAYDESTDHLDSDITPPSGAPFSDRRAAELAAARHDGGRVFPVEGGFVVRTPQAAQAAAAPAAQAQSLPQAPQAPAQGAAREVARQAAETPSGTNAAAAAPQQAGQQVAPSAQPAPGNPALSTTAGAAGRSETSRVPSANHTPAAPTTEVGRARGPMNVRMGGQEYPVGSVEEASAKFLQLRDQAGDIGGMRAVELTDASGKTVGHIDHNGEVYAGPVGARQANAKPIYDPQTPNRYGKDVIDAAAHEAATSPLNDRAEPTDAQKEAGNYKKGHARIAGLDISIENPAGSKRREEWPALAHHYGYIKGTIGKDKDHVDVFLTEHAADTSRPVFVVDQRTKAGKFDEHKVVLGAANMAEARKAYLANYSKGWKGAGRVTQMTHAEFEQWVRDPNKTTRPAAASFKAAAPVETAQQQTQPAPAKPQAPLSPQQQQAQIQADFAANRAAIKAKGLKKGDTVSYTAGNRTFTGEILSLGDPEQAVVAVGVKSARGVADHHVPAAHLTKVGAEEAKPAAATTPEAKRWDAMTLEQRAAVLAQPGGWGTVKGTGLNPSGKTIAARSWADHPEGTRATIAKLLEKKPAAAVADSTPTAGSKAAAEKAAGQPTSNAYEQALSEWDKEVEKNGLPATIKHAEAVAAGAFWRKPFNQSREDQRASDTVLRATEAWLERNRAGQPTTEGLQPRVRMVQGKKEFVPGARETLEAYFQPGREIKSYGGTDRVLSFDWNNGDWRVTVQGLTFNGKDVTNERPRSHSTLPSTKELRAVFGSPEQYSRVAKTKAAAKTAPKASSESATATQQPLRNFSWDAVKLADAHSYDDLNRLRAQVETEHANPKDAEGHPTENGKSTIYLYDREGRRKLDALAWAVTYKQQESRAERERIAKEAAAGAEPPQRQAYTVETPRAIATTPQAPAAPAAPIKMTMAEYKAVHRDHKGMVDGQRTVMQGGRLVPVEIVKEGKAATPKAQSGGEAVLSNVGALVKRMRQGEATLADYKAAWTELKTNREAVKEHLADMKKADLLELAGPRYKNDRKDLIVRGALEGLQSRFQLGRTLTFSMTADGNGHAHALDALVEKTTQADLDKYAQDHAEARAERAAAVAGIEDPKTLEDFARRSRMLGSEEKLTPEQRQRFDELRTEARREQREAEAKRNAVVRQVDTGNTGMALVETKHTQKGHDLFVVRMDDRVERDVYDRLNQAAKRLGGHYSSYRGNGAVPGFTFTTRAAAEQFMAVREGNVDTSAQQQARQEAKAEARAESLGDKAEAAKAKALEKLNRDRKDNTARRARMANSAEADARRELAIAETMGKLAQAIESGKAKLLSFVRHKTQVELLDHLLRMAHDDHMRAQGVNWEKAKEEPITAADIANTAMPRFAISRGDAIRVARRLVNTRGGKQLGVSLGKMVDYGEEYGKAVQEQPHRFVLGLSRRDGETGAAVFATKRDADAVLARSPEKAKGTVVKLPDGFIGDRSKKWAVVLAPDLAIERKLWAPDFDKKVFLSPAGAQNIVDTLKVQSSGDHDVPYIWHTYLERRQALAKLGIENGYELREALREYLALRQAPAEEDRVRKLERELAGKKDVGVDFFPTPPAVVQRLIDQADIGPGMRVLEPSAGKGDIAEAARDAAERVHVDTVEMSSTLRDLLEAKGFDPQSGDFLDVKPDTRPVTRDELQAAHDVARGEARSMMEGALRAFDEGDKAGAEALTARATRTTFYTDFLDLAAPLVHRMEGGLYDRVVMNPPFNNDNGASHVMHAYSMLKPGGRLVAVMGTGQRGKETFEKWLDKVGGLAEPLPEGSFKSSFRPTGVATQVVVIDKPTGGEKTAQEHEGAAAPALFSKAGRAGSDRADWAGFPKAVIAEPFGPGQQQLRTHPDYEAAKAGDRAAAVRLVGDRLTPEAVQRVRELIGDRKPTLVPVLAEEATGRNKIPLAYAEALGEALGLPVARDVVQSVRAHHTSAGAFHRLAFQAVFDGPVEHGADYLVIDDALTMGGTLANLRGHLEAGGGHVIGATVLTGHPNGATMALQPATAQRLRETFGHDLDRYLEDEFGFDSSRLTEGEAGHILAARTLDAVRDRVAQARVAAGRPVDGRVLRSASDRVGSQGGLTLDRAQELKAELTAHWGDNAPSIRLVASADDLPAGIKADPDFRRIEGVYNGSPVIWLNVGRIQTEQRFGQVLAHEALGHYGVERVVGAQEWGRIADAIARLQQNGASAQLRKIFDEIQRKQPGLDRDAFAREAIAFMAEKGIRNSFVARVVAAARRFLRRVMPALQWSEGDVRDLLSQADSFLRAPSATPAERRALVQRYAFSADGHPQYGESGLQVDETPVDTAFVAGLSPSERKSPAMAMFANGLYQDLGTDSPFFRDWFGDSKVVDEKGAPLQVYHGTGDEFSAFDPARAGKSTGHMTAGLGIFFDGQKDKAEHYAEIASNGVPVDQHVYEVYLKIDKPYEMSGDDFMALDSSEATAQLRARLEREGYDGVHLKDFGQWVAFRADQIKATDNRGTFDRGDNRMLFSKAPADVVDDLDAVTREATQYDKSILDKARTALKNTTPDGLATLAKKVKDSTRSSWLGFLTTRHLTQLGSDHFATMHHYSDYLGEMGADRNALQQEGEQVAEPVRQWAGKNRQEAHELFDLQHDATIDGVDPAEAFQPLQFRYSGQLHDATPKNVREALAAIKEQMRGRGADNKTDMLAEAKMIRGLPARDKKRRAVYPDLVERWNRLSPEAQQHYRAMRDLYAKRSQQVEDALVQRIEELRGDQANKSKARLINTIRQQFESARLQGVYFPLQRFGQYFVAAERDGTNTFQMFENQDQLERAVKGLRDRGFNVVAQGRKGEQRAKDAPSGTFVADVLEKLNKAGASEKMQDEIYQLYLQALPELSMRKHAIHRQTVPGFDPDALRAFAFNMTHGAHQLARLRYSHKLQNVIDVLREQQEARRRDAGGDTRQIVAGDVILDELDKRHEWISNPQASALVNKISSAGFLYYLGITPAAALVNLTQVPLLALPHLGSRFGGVKAMNALLAGMKDSVRTGGHIQRTLTDPDELRAHAYLQRSGALDKTQAHNLSGIAEGGLDGHNPAWATAMKWIGMPFHVAEVINRESTGMATYRLARAEGMNFDEAVKLAHDAVQETMFDYSNQNRARFMQDGWKKVLLMFRQYSLNMTWHLGRMLWQSTKGESPEVKRIARRNLAGVLGMSALFSGTLGLPLMSVTMGMLNAIASSVGDDDEPWDAETEFRAFLADMLGETGAQIVADGPVNKLTGADIGSRVSMSQLWFRDADRELEGAGAYDNLLEQAAGPMGGALKNFYVGKQLIDQGHTWRGVETMLPKALKDVMKGLRYQAQGVNTLRGDPLVDDLGVHEALLQAAGFTPTRVAEQYEKNSALKNYEQALLDRRARLIDAYAMAQRLGDTDARSDVLDQIRNFDRTNPSIAITGKSLRASMRARARYSARAENGITLNRRLANRVKDLVED